MDGRRKPNARWLLIGGALVAVIGLIGAAVAGSAGQLSYQVMVAEPPASGKVPACRSTELFVDRSRGAELPCAGTPVEGFTPADREQILKLSSELAADGGIDEVDGFKLTELAAKIGRGHNDASNKAAPLAFGVVAALGGAAFATGIALKVIRRRP
jgi:hypothetical protein